MHPDFYCIHVRDEASIISIDVYLVSVRRKVAGAQQLFQKGLAFLLVSPPKSLEPQTSSIPIKLTAISDRCHSQSDAPLKTAPMSSRGSINQTFLYWLIAPQRVMQYGVQYAVYIH